MGGREGIVGGAVTDRRGSYAGERGRRARDGDEVVTEGEMACAADPLGGGSAERGPGVLMLSLREKLGSGGSRWGEERALVLAVLWDQRFMLAAPSRKAAMPSAAPLAALERRREAEAEAEAAEGGGVARCAWGLEGSGRVSRSDNDSDADRLRVVTADDEDSDVLRDEERRRWCCWCCDLGDCWWTWGRGPEGLSSDEAAGGSGPAGGL